MEYGRCRFNCVLRQKNHKHFQNFVATKIKTKKESTPYLYLTFLLILPALLLVSGAEAGPQLCILRTSCAPGETAINMSLYELRDSHVRNDTIGSYVMCCPFYYGSASEAWASLRLCTANDATALALYNATDSHANKPDTPWNTKVCLLKPSLPPTITYTSNDCRIRPSCGTGELCVASLYQLTDSHVAECGIYINNICCCPSGYRWDSLSSKCIPSSEKCADIPHDAFYCGQPNSPTGCTPVDYSKCCFADDPAVPGANYSVWEAMAPTEFEAGKSILVCNQVIECGATTTRGGPDGICPQDILPGFTCSICDADCGGDDVCNAQQGSTVCTQACTSIGPIVSVQNAPAKWQNESWIAGVGCTPTGSSCNTGSFRLKFYPDTNPGVCSTNYVLYTQSSEITDYGFVCAAAKDVSGNAGFSLPRESLVDKEPPDLLIAASPDPPSAGETVTFTAIAGDSKSGVDMINITVNGVVVKTCMFAGGESHLCQYQSSFSGGTVTYNAVANDTARNINQSLQPKSFAVITGCIPVRFPYIYITPDPARAGETVTITAEADSALGAAPLVYVTPGVDSGYTQRYQATFRSSSGNRYEYTFDIGASHPPGRALVEIEAMSCGSRRETRTFEISSARALVGTLRIIPNTARIGETIEAIFSCVIRNRGNNENVCTNVNTQINEVRITDRVGTLRNYLFEEGIANPNSKYKSSHTAVNGAQFDNVWVFPINTRKYQSTVRMTATLSGISGTVQGSYEVQTDTYIDVNIEFLDVANNIVPLTTDGRNIPNYTRAMPINIVSEGVINTESGMRRCDDRICTAQFKIDIGDFANMNYDPFKRAFTGSSPSNSLSCDSVHTVTVVMTDTRPSGSGGTGATGTETKEFFISCSPRLTVVPLEARAVVGDRGTKTFDVTIWNPKNAADYTLEMATTKPPEDLLVLGFLDIEGDTGTLPDRISGDHKVDAIHVDAVSWQTRRVSLSNDVGAGRSGAFGLRFVATDKVTEKNYIAFGNLLIFAEGLDEFAAWQLVVIMLIVVLIYYRYGDNIAKEAKKRGATNKYHAHVYRN